MSKLTLNHVVTAINEVWISRYGGDATANPKALILRVQKIAEDRDSWLANSKAIQKENNRLEKEGETTA
jgi:hypothetical protein